MTSRIAATGGGFLRDVRLGLIGLVAVASVVAPGLALRQGALACGVVAALSLAGGDWRPAWLDIAVLSIGGLAVASTTWTVAPEVTALSALNLAAAAGIFAAVRATLQDRRTILVIAFGYVVGCAWAAFDLVLQGGTRYSFDLTAQRLSLDTARGTSSNYLAYAFAACLAVLVVIWRLKRPALVGRLVVYGTVLLMWLGMVQAGTRGAAAGAALLILWLVVQRFVPGRGLPLLWGGAVALFALILTGWADRVLARLSGPTTRDTGTLNGRLELWPLAREVALDHPVWGVGAGAFQVFNPLQAAAHDVLLDLATGLGAVGVVLFVATVVLAVRESRGMDVAARTLLVGSFVAALTPALATGAWLEAPALWVILALVSRIGVVSLPRQEGRARPEPGRSPAQARTPQPVPGRP